jgi:hypothetical protein
MLSFSQFWLAAVARLKCSRLVGIHFSGHNVRNLTLTPSACLRRARMKSFSSSPFATLVRCEGLACRLDLTVSNEVWS